METLAIEQSQRINLKRDNLKYSDSTQRRFHYFLAGLWLLLSLGNLFYGSKGAFAKLGMPSMYFLLSLYYFFTAQIVMSTTSRYAPHFLISEAGIKIKKNVFKKSEFINWDAVKKVELGNYKIGIKDKTGTQYYPYQTRKETSIKLKRTIETFANQKGIEVENLLKR